MSNSGWLHVITGPMFSGKTEALIRIIKQYDIKGQKTVVFRPSIDTRTPTVESRNGITYPAQSISSQNEIDMKLLWGGLYYPVIAFDEAQFFDSYIVDTIKTLLDPFHRTIIVAGLDKDFLQRSFGPMGELLTLADEVTKLTAVCSVCKIQKRYEDGIGNPATLTQRLVNGEPAKPDDPTILVGGIGDDKYEARCRRHHEIGKNV